MTPVFEEIAGRDISYRTRERSCTSCGQHFHSVEMAFDFLSALIREVQRLREESVDMGTEIKGLREQDKTLRASMRKTATQLRRDAKQNGSG
jgi:hypothetical protein